jgi:anti-sigma regulatory factor (Ser/Thr protein kinase)
LTTEGNPADSESGFTATVALAADAEAAAVARDFVFDNRDHLRPEVIEDAQLLVSEIVTNAVKYGRTDITLSVRLDSPGIGIVVRDAGEQVPVLPKSPPDPDARGGRGLLIVDAIASAWGVTPNDSTPGKSVWFDVRPS